MSHYDYIVIGAGSAGRSAVETLVSEAPGSTILLLDSEEPLPYKRTKVSKSVFSGYDINDFAIHTSDWYSENGVDLIVGLSASSVDPEHHKITVNRNVYSYSFLLFATGAAPRTPQIELPPNQWSPLWTAGDGLYIRKRINGLKRVAIVGTGVLGIEASWQTTLSGLDTILVGRDERPMAGYLDSVTSGLLRNAVSDAGVTQYFRHNVEKITGRQDSEDVILVTDKGEFSADFAIVTVGSQPNTSLAEAAGLRVYRGISVDSGLKTSVQDVWAAGDCAEHPGGKITGLWHSAEQQGQLAALGMLGRPVDNKNPPFRLKCEVFGGFWFSAGPVNSGDAAIDPAETWESDGVVWRPRFRNGTLASLTGAAVQGMEKSKAKKAQEIILRGADRSESRIALGVSPV